MLNVYLNEGLYKELVIFYTITSTLTLLREKTQRENHHIFYFEIIHNLFIY